MCKFVVPIRTCSKCHQNEPLFDEKERRLSHVNEKNEVPQSSMVGSHVAHCVPNSESQHTWYPPQDCYSRWCVFSSEHPITCSSCRITCKRTHGKTRKIRGGSPSYVCHSCISCPQRHCPWQLPRGMGTSVLRLREIGWFAGLIRSSAK
ncbi:hypothetical protein DFJ58DRAFT_823115 [Suillus subalutaceus]|uniref:uncharacterized protein n=1 Tax=Suillus subalutaceus TaxID=48586 RepID=UPI001B88276A|nr:uncharacterized protein DFJ58DRAFT_823115 [Suillus subalutaceus]KAG1832574.1 hypothetical protein DFJ58DRAFT_823115 [Suillus subalutaceus]